MPGLVVLLVFAGMLHSCGTAEPAPPLTKVEGGYSVNFEKNLVDLTQADGKLIDLIVMDLGPLANATAREDTAAFVDAVMSEDKYVVKVTGTGKLTSPAVLFVATNDVLSYDPTHQHTLIVDLHDPENTKAHPNLHGTLGCGSCQLLNQFEPMYTNCLTGGKKRCITCVSCALSAR